MVKNLPANAGDPWVEKTPWRRKWQSTPVFLPEKFRGQRSLMGYNPRGHRESDMTEHTHKCYSIHHLYFTFSLMLFKSRLCCHVYFYPMFVAIFTSPCFKPLPSHNEWYYREHHYTWLLMDAAVCYFWLVHPEVELIGRECMYLI